MNYLEFVKECFKYHFIGFIIELLWEEGKIIYNELIKPNNKKQC